MKQVAALAALSILSAFGEGPYYEPAYQITTSSMDIVWLDELGIPQMIAVDVDVNGEVVGGFVASVDDITHPAYPAYIAAKKAMAAEVAAMQNNEWLESLDAKIHELETSINSEKDNAAVTHDGFDGRILVLEGKTNSVAEVDNESLIVNSAGKLSINRWGNIGNNSILGKRGGVPVEWDLLGENGVETRYNFAGSTPLQYFGLSNWTNASNCEENLASLLTDPAKRSENESHKILTRKVESGGGVSLHYMEIGDPGLFGGGAVKFVGTDSESRTVGGPGATTNTVTFASAADSNVEVKVGGEDGDVTITIGVYYK
jgi:hypothetical protein